jgi:hypothetical protein
MALLDATGRDEMAGLAHLGVGLAAKGASPRTPLWALVAASYVIDIVFIALQLLGKERMPRTARAMKDGGSPAAKVQAGTGSDQTDPPAPWSHGLFMATIWSTLTGLLAWWVSRRPGTGFVIGLVAFSHWIVDFITQPMTAVFPRQSKLPLFLGGSRRVGLGLYRTKTAVNVVDYGSVAAGLAIYLRASRKLRRARATEDAVSSGVAAPLRRQ